MCFALTANTQAVHNDQVDWCAPVAGAPVRADSERKRTYKTKKETAKSKGVTATVVVSLLAIAVVVPMLQYYGYVSKE